jgi:hypothetical protein
VHDLRAGLFILDHFDQRDEMRRIPKMRADDAVAMFEMAPDVGRGNGRTVAGENRLRRNNSFEIRKNALLERKPFRRCFEHKGRAVDSRGKPILRRNLFEERRRIVIEEIGDCLQTLGQRAADLRCRFEHTDLVAGRGEKISNAVAHQAAADHAYFLLTHLCLGAT